MINFIPLILCLTILIYTNDFEEPRCYCLNSIDGSSAMIDNCIKFTNDKKFIYFWHSDISTIEETGYWSQSNDTITINSFDSYHDYFKITRTKKTKKAYIDSVMVNIFYKENKSQASYFRVINEILNIVTTQRR